MELRLKELREERGISCGDIAKDLKIDPKAVWRWENNKNEITALNLIKLANYFEVSTDYLLGRNNDTGLIVTDANLTSAESNMLALFRRLSEPMQYKAIGVIQALAG